MKENKAFAFPNFLNRPTKRRSENEIEETHSKTPIVTNQQFHDVTINQVEKRANPTINTNSFKNEEKDIDFCENEGATHIIYWQDCISQTIQDIQEQQKSCLSTDFHFLKPPIMQYLFTVCIRLRLPNHVRFTAALIFNTYMIRQIASLYKFLQDQEDLNGPQKVKEWENIETNLERQIPLRLLTAIQISSKVHSYHDSLSSRQVANCLRSLSFPYPIDAVLKSELRMYKIIGFKIPESPLIICEMLMKVFSYTMQKRNWIENEQYDILWQHVLVVLDICFLHHPLVYEKFIARKPIIDPQAQLNDLTIARLKCDFLLLSSAVIQVAVHCVISEEDSQTASDVINQYLSTNPENGRKLYKSIIELVEEQQI